MSDEIEGDPSAEWSDEELLERLAERAEERRATAIAERFEAGTAHRAPAAADQEEEEEEEERRLAELFRPLDDAELDRIAARLAPRVEQSASSDPRAPRLPRPPRWHLRRTTWLAVAASLAAAIAVTTSLERANRSALEPLPSYAVELSGAPRDLRSAGEPEAIATVARDTELELVLRPARPIAGPLQVRAFARSSAETTPLPGAWSISENGAARLAGKAAELFGGAGGELELVLAIGRPPLSEHLDLETTAPAEDLRVVKLRLRVRAEQDR